MRATLISVFVMGACSQGAPDPTRHPTNPGDEASVPGPPPVITIEVADSCADIVPCGGDVVGTWHTEAVCVEREPLLADLMLYCPDTIIDDISESLAQGVMTFAASSVTREINTAITVDVRFPFSCVACDCDAIALEIEEEDVAVTCDSTCTPGSQCVCSVRSHVFFRDVTPYEISGNTFAASDGTTFDYCIDGDTLTYVETTASVQEPGVVTLSRQ